MDKLRLMKLAFLARREGHLSAQTATYGFVPYHHGPFSFTLYRDIAKLAEEQELVEDKATVGLRSREDLPTLEAANRVGVDALWDRYGSWDTDRLITYVYGRYPWYTVNAKDPSKRDGSRPVADPGVYTVGYEKLSFDDFLDRLLRCGIRRVIDVRANPVARRYGFHRSTLDRNLKSLDIDYVHVPELGIPGEERANLTTVADYSRLFARYESDTLPKQKPAIARVAALQREKPTALLCMEADPEQCHRSRLGRVVAAETGLAMQDLGYVATA
ncbi:MAG: DUF488 domain-containing protein [Planctomycetes bacterium]|nr:DUF488 domain-containing protein [Planctomycetota bacterium]